MQVNAGELREEFVSIAPARAGSSAVSWAAILAGAAATAALSLLLLMLGFGLGLSAVSPWSERGADSSSVGLAALAWIAFTQIIASGVGGYLAGRLRIKWADTQGDEIYFRDTAHGLLSWAIASLAAATLLGSAAALALSGGLQAGVAAVGVGAGAGGAAAAHAVTTGNGAADGSRAMPGHHAADGLAKAANPLEYFADALFRAEPAATQPANSPGNVNSPANPTANASAQAMANQSAAPDRRAAAAEAAKIFAYDFPAGALSAEDREYLGRLIGRYTGLDQSAAEKRATDVFYQLTSGVAKAEMAAKEAVDKARKAAAHTSLWMFVALLAGAFCASLSATFGGRQRDEI